jgi:HNH endonuclease
MMEQIPEATQRRFWKRVELAGQDECWVWLGGKFVSGYGKCWIRGRDEYAHRFAYEDTIGPIAEGQVIDHRTCDNKPCVNPHHMEATTIGANVLRGIGPTAMKARQTHCIHGHELTPENVYVPPKRPGRRYCRACMEGR